MDNHSLFKGALLKVAGTVRKVIKRDGQCKLMIESRLPLMTVFADCLDDAGTVAARRIRKGSEIELKGKVASFGSSAVCLSDCSLT